MKKNDFDFVKDKMDQSGVKAPDHMDENFVLNKIATVQSDTTAGPKIIELDQKKRRRRWVAGVAAAFVAVVTLSVFAYFAFIALPMPAPAPENLKNDPAPSVKANIPLKQFDSYNELKEAAKSAEENKREPADILYDYDSAEAGNADSDKPLDNASGSSSGSTSDGATGSYSETYKQVEGVDEGDIVKTDGRYLYVLSQGNTECVFIYSAADDPQLLTTVYPASLDDPTAAPKYTDDEDEPDVFVEEMYLSGDNMIVVCMNRDKHFTYSTAAMVYDISDIEHIRLIDQLHQSGYYERSRMIGDTLYMISEETVYSEDFETPVCYRGDEADEIPIGCVYAVEEPTDNQLMIVGGYDLSSGSDSVQTSAVLGSFEDVYCNEDNMYLYSTKWRYSTIVDYAVEDAEIADSYVPVDTDPIKTAIYKVSLKDGITFTAYTEFEGWLDSRYALDERDGFLRVAVTTEDENTYKENHLYILDGDLNKVGSVDGFAPNESVKAVRYVGDTAYVITYEQTDPLFVIDVSDPESPSILGEVKIDGFSSMLVPIDDNTVLGLGYHTTDGSTMQVQSGFKLALFDVSDKLNPKVLDEKVYSNYYSPVMTEPRALVYNPDRGDYIVPLNFEDAHLNSTVNSYKADVRGGMLNFKVENGKIVEIDRAEVPQSGDDNMVSRCLYVNDNIYMISSEYYGDTKVFTAKYK